MNRRGTCSATSSSSSFNHDSKYRLSLPLPISSPPIFTGRRNIFVVHFFLGGRRQSDSILWILLYHSILAPSVLPLWNAVQRFLHRSNLHSFFFSSFYFPLVTVRGVKRKETRREGKKKRRDREESKKKKENGFLWVGANLSFFLSSSSSIFLFFLFVKDRIHGCGGKWFTNELFELFERSVRIHLFHKQIFNRNRSHELVNTYYLAKNENVTVNEIL